MSDRAVQTSACDRCLRRPWLLARLSAHLDRLRGRIQELLMLDDNALVAAVAGRDVDPILRELDRVDVDRFRGLAARAHLEPICRCDPSYPSRLLDLAAPPAVLFVAGGLGFLSAMSHGEPVAIVGARRASRYGLEVARSLGAALGRAAVPVISGMAIGIDAAAHTGALSVGGPTLAVLAGAASKASPASKRTLHHSILASGAVVSELGPGSQPRRWSFPARNRLIAALAAMTVVVEGGERSGALLTARLASEVGRPVGAVPGRVDSPEAAGPNDLLSRGARLVRNAQDVVDHLYGVGVVEVGADPREPLAGELHALQRALRAGNDTVSALASAGVTPGEGLAALARLELAGYVRRVSGGRYELIP
jgi:DNA processing protein